MARAPAVWSGVCALVVVGLLAVPAAAAGASDGYSRSYTGTAPADGNASVDLTALGAATAGGGTLSISFSVAAPAILDRPDTGYRIEVFNTSGAGPAGAGACGTVQFSNDASFAAAVFFECAGPAPVAEGGVAELPISLSNGGRTLTVAVNLSWLPPPDRFALEATSFDAAAPGTCLGYGATPGCGGGAAATGRPSGGGISASVLEASVAGFGLLAGVAVVGGRLLRRRRRPPPRTEGTSPGSSEAAARPAHGAGRI